MADERKGQEFDNLYQDEKLDELIPLVAEGISYSGFNPSAFRRTIIESGMTAKDLLVALTTLAIMGNNPNRLTEQARVVNINLAAKVAGILRKYNVGGPGQAQNVTLARIGIAFIGMYARLRKYLVQQRKVAKQFAIELDALYQDPNMGAIAVAHGKEYLYRDYEHRINQALASGRQRGTPSDWLEVACRGLSTDEVSLAMLASFRAEGDAETPSQIAGYFQQYIDNVAGPEKLVIPPLETSSLTVETPAVRGQPPTRAVARPTAPVVVTRK